LYEKGCAALASLPEGELEARLLLCRAASISEEAFYSAPGAAVSKMVEADYFDLLRRRLSGVPTAYLVGHKEFWSMVFDVGPGVLIPRPETELLVEKALELVEEGRSGPAEKAASEPSLGSLGRSETESSTVGSAIGKDSQSSRLDGEGLVIADIGTGSGCIALSLAGRLPVAKIYATDASEDALKVARKNGQRLGITNVRFLEGDLFEPLERLGLVEACDMIVSNPPYVSQGEWETLDREISEHEPREALVAGESGLEVIERLVAEAPRYLKAGGWLIFELGYGQKEAAMALFSHNLEADCQPCSSWRGVACFEDLAGIPRVITAQWGQKLGLS
jgi:release factor glutamine methyltransferase